MRNGADRLIELLDLKPHPEGGYFRETFRDCGLAPADQDTDQGRGHSTAIYFLLRAGEMYRGAPLELSIGRRTYILGPDIDQAQVPQIVVPAGAWQAARSLGDYTLVGCTVAPGFSFEHFELAPEGFRP